MTLRALSEYFDRLSDDPNVHVAPFGFEQKNIEFVIVLDEGGAFVNLLDFRESRKGNSKGRISLVPKGVKKTSGIAANLLWDGATYVLGKVLRCEKKKKLAYRKIAGKKTLQISASKKELHKLNQLSKEKRIAFTEKTCELLKDVEDSGAQALVTFLEKGDFESVYSHLLWKDVEEYSGNITFMLSGDKELLCQRKSIVQYIRKKVKPEGVLQRCAISGEKDVIAGLHTAIKGVWGTQQSGGNIVSFNKDSFCSYDKKQGYNAPVGCQTEFEYTTALNYLLASKEQRMQIGDASTVFWAEKSCELETDFYSYLLPSSDESDTSCSKIRNLLSSIKTGVPPREEEISFYILGLAPNAARIAIRFWYEGTVAEVKKRLALHFNDIEIVRAPHDSEFLSLFQILVAMATEGKADNIPPNLGGELARAIFTGTNYPRTLLAGAVRRCKAEQKVTRARAAIIKACLVRRARFASISQEEVGMALDKGYDNIGYVLGRLFAVLERIQEQASGPGLNKTIRETYFGAAASSPRVIFKRLNDLSIHHLAKLRNSGKNIVWWEKQKQEIFSLIPATGIPAVLSLDDQGRFAVGYYHQRQEFFTKNEEIDKKQSEEQDKQGDVNHE